MNPLDATKINEQDAHWRKTTGDFEGQKWLPLGFMLDFNKHRIDFVGTIGNNFEWIVADNYEQQNLGFECERAYE